MSFYTFLVFIHVLAAVSLFAAWGIEAMVAGRLRRAATADEARIWAGLAGKQNPLAPIAMLSLLGTGIAMMALVWGPRAWMTTAIGALVVMGAITSILRQRAMGGRSKVTARDAGEVTEAQRQPLGPRATGEVLVRSLTLRISGGVGVLALMVVKPGWVGSLAIAAGAFVVGIGLAAVVGGSRRVALE
jgi:hypothetical protein